MELLPQLYIADRSAGIILCRTRNQYGVQYRHERATGIEPASSAWEADVLPLYYARIKKCNSEQICPIPEHLVMTGITGHYHTIPTG